MGVVSHRSAAAIQNLGDLDADTHTFTVPRRRHTRSPDVAFRVADLDRRDWHRVDGLPATRPLRTVTDLAADQTDGGYLASIVRDAILTGDTNAAELSHSLRPYAIRYGGPAGDGTALVRTFIHEAGAPTSAIDLATLSTDVDQNAVVIQALTASPEWPEIVEQVRNLLVRTIAPKLNSDGTVADR
ncbi:hypothetical protein OHB26_20960 [Nocardia sp. NBC_01503]|uniref:hypothetical protein n=1 Tax=Nocardia sp. NBC_01503 TaxID=2975997 RepID=UPI002E7B76F8|nr:hypothetical protein [Nocardia sp. NBC_01503]WTL29470.1 hypothetical protein OHB26_20960 [Nocardia sp. NBC_01503]